MRTEIINTLLRPFGLKAIPEHHDLLHYQHEYGPEGFNKYRSEQIAANKRKIDRVFADERTLGVIARDIRHRGLDRRGLCHGARNGFEVQWLSQELGCEVIGTDISDTATQFPNMVQHDFHERRDDWMDSFSFIYSNSLDQAFDPARALDSWVEQLTPNGRIYLEHTASWHSPAAASEMDPFGAHPMVIPYLLFDWGRGKYALNDIYRVDAADKKVGKAPKGQVWVFVICPASASTVDKSPGIADAHS